MYRRCARNQRTFQPQDQQPDPTMITGKSSATATGSLMAISISTRSHSSATISTKKRSSARPCEAAMMVRASAVAPRTQLQSGAISPADPIARRSFTASTRAERRCRGRLRTVQYLGEFFRHDGSPYSYDTHVPMIIMGQGITPGATLKSVARRPCADAASFSACRLRATASGVF